VKRSREEYVRNKRAKYGYTRLKQIKDKAVNLSSAQYETIMGDWSCHYCGGDVGLGVGLDRIDSRYGYSAKNVVPSCWPCNNLKADLLTVDETKAIIQTLKKLRGSNVWAASTKRKRRRKKDGIQRNRG